MFKQLRLCLIVRKAGQLILKALLFTVKLAYSELIRQSTKKWFEDFISTQEQNTLLNETDRKYLECLRKEIQKHFGGKIRYELLLDMRAKPTMLFHWLRKAPRLGISHKSVYISMIKAILGQK